MYENRTAVYAVDHLIHAILPTMLEELGLPRKAHDLRNIGPVDSIAAARAAAPVVADILEYSSSRTGGHYDALGDDAAAGSDRRRRYAASHLGMRVEPLLTDPRGVGLFDAIFDVFGMYEHAWSFVDPSRCLRTIGWDSAQARSATQAVIDHAQHRQKSVPEGGGRIVQ